MKFAVIAVLFAACAAAPRPMPSHRGVLEATAETGGHAHLPLETRIRACNDPSGDVDVRVLDSSGVRAFDRAVVHDAESWSIAGACEQTTVRYQP